MSCRTILTTTGVGFGDRDLEMTASITVALLIDL